VHVSFRRYGGPAEPELRASAIARRRGEEKGAKRAASKASALGAVCERRRTRRAKSAMRERLQYGGGYGGGHTPDWLQPPPRHYPHKSG
jgi:hypothetical protein